MSSTFVVRLDYATFAFTRDSVDLPRIEKALADGHDLGFRRFGDYDSAPSQSPLGLYYKPECGSKENPHILQVSGSACEHFRLTLPELANVMYAGGDQAHFRRLDFAFDVIMKRSQWRDYLSKCFKFSMEQTRKVKRFLLQGSGEAMTVYIGSRVSDRFFRVYNKTLEDPAYKYLSFSGQEVPVQDDECVIRYELELKRYPRVIRGERIVNDPSSLFYSYYCNPDVLFAELKKRWLSFGDEIMLPDDFANCEFVTDLQVKGYSFGCSDDGQNCDNAAAGDGTGISHPLRKNIFPCRARLCGLFG